MFHSKLCRQDENAKEEKKSDSPVKQEESRQISPKMLKYLKEKNLPIILAVILIPVLCINNVEKKRRGNTSYKGESIMGHFGLCIARFPEEIQGKIPDVVHA